MAAVLAWTNLVQAQEVLSFKIPADTFQNDVKILSYSASGNPMRQSGWVEIVNHPDAPSEWVDLLETYRKEIARVEAEFPSVKMYLPLTVELDNSIDFFAAFYAENKKISFKSAAIRDVGILRHELGHAAIFSLMLKEDLVVPLADLYRKRLAVEVPSTAEVVLDFYVNEGFFFREQIPDVYSLSIELHPSLFWRINSPQKLSVSGLRARFRPNENAPRYDDHIAGRVVEAFLQEVSKKFNRPTLFQNWYRFLKGAIEDPESYQVTYFAYKEPVAGKERAYGYTELSPNKLLSRFLRASFNDSEREQVDKIRKELSLDADSLKQILHEVYCSEKFVCGIYFDR